MKTILNSRAKTFAIFAILAAIWLILDQATKAAMTSILESVGSIVLLPGILELQLVHNIGAAWGLFGGATVALVVLSLAVCVIIIAYLAKMWQDSNTLVVVGASLVFAGGIGNMIDRLAHGYVIDFISTVFIDFPVFNIADIGVTCGIVLFLIGLITSKEKA